MAQTRAAERNNTRQRVLDYIRTVYERDGIAPSIREIMRGIGTSQGSTHYHLTNLVRTGALRSGTRGTSRRWVPMPPAPATTQTSSAHTTDGQAA